MPDRLYVLRRSPESVSTQSISADPCLISWLANWTFVELDKVGSTQAVAKGLAAMGAPEGTTVVAKSQSSGQGRMGRAWLSPAGGLYMSIVLRPGTLPGTELITLIAATAVVRGLRNSTHLVPTIRWPNDVMVNGKKIAGVIAEAQTYRNEVTQVVVGVGVNCNAPVSEAEGLSGDATSTSEQLGRHEEVSVVKHSILDAFSQLYDKWKAGGDVAQAWRESVGTLGKQVSIKLKTEETPFSCVAEGIEESGNLVVTRGTATAVVSPEDLEWLRESG